ncbi:MAG: GHMP kinase [Candidatus Thorarchaeota archaeon]|nr:MAG: GHMP kinase [Candidatus Thorarchaeota archaeon]
MTNTLSRHAERARAFVPGHITGMFSIHDTYEDPLMSGSRGAGFSVEAGIITEVEAVKDDTLGIIVDFNDERIEAPVTETVVRSLLEDYEMQFKVSVQHTSSIPVGVGFGASGAAALGTALALAHIIDENIGPTKAAQYAHLAEIVNKTGLGDVLAQTMGGLEIRRHPGGPGHGDVINITPPASRRVLLAGSIGLETRDVLANPKSRSLVNDAGEKAVSKLLQNPTFDEFISVSREFSGKIGLMTERVSGALAELTDAGYEKSSMVMLGDSVFCFCGENEVADAAALLQHHWDESEILQTNLTESGGGLV